MHIDLPPNAEYIINALTDAGFEAYAVGGAVRDKIMGREADDMDITTSALPEETKKVFSAYPVLETGIKHGTVTVLLDRIPYEVTTYRTESAYSDSRHPDKVNFVRNLIEDLARRDFTMNSIAYSPIHGIVDPFGGVSDIKSKTVRAVGDPYKRFGEDALRILRALRFSSVLGFDIEKNTASAVFALADTVNKVSPERVFTEIKKLLCGKNARAVVSTYLECLKKIFPVSGTPEKLDLLPEDQAMRISCLCGNAVADALDFLRADNNTKNICKALVNSKPIPTDETELKFYISALGREVSETVAIYRRALYGEDPNSTVETVLNSDVCLTLKELAVNGDDIKKLGINGRQVGIVLQNLLSAVILGETENKKSPLLTKAMVLTETSDIR